MGTDNALYTAHCMEVVVTPAVGYSSSCCWIAVTRVDQNGSNLLFSAKPKKKQAPKFVQKCPDTVDCVEGDTITLEVNVTGYPEPRVLWSKADKPITNETPGYKMEVDGSTHRLVITNITPKMASLYNAKAESPAGQTSCRSRVKVKRK